MKKSLQNYFDEYVEYCIYSKRLRPETIRGYKESFRHFTAMMPEIISPDLLSVSVMNQFFKKLQVRERIVGKNTKKVGVKDSTIRTYWSKLNSFFVWLSDTKVITENPLPKIKTPEPVYDDLPALKKGEIERMYSATILNAKNPLTSKRDVTMMSLLLFTGVRKTECISLQIRDIDMERGILTIRAETSKSKRPRQIPIHPTLSLHLKDYLGERTRQGYKTQSLLVSSNKDSGLSSHGFKHWVKRLNDLSGVKFHLHQLRHTFACNLARNNAGSIIIQKLLGHTDLRMTQRYLRSLGVDDLRDDIYKLGIDNLL